MARDTQLELLIEVSEGTGLRAILRNISPAE